MPIIQNIFIDVLKNNKIKSLNHKKLCLQAKKFNELKNIANYLFFIKGYIPKQIIIRRSGYLYIIKISNYQ